MIWHIKGSKKNGKNRGFDIFSSTTDKNLRGELARPVCVTTYCDKKSDDISRICFEVGGSGFVCRFETMLLWGKFPTWRPIIPSKWNAIYRYGVPGILSALKSVKTMLTNEQKSANFAFSESGLLEINAATECGSIREAVRGECDLGSNSMSVRLDVGQILGVLESISSCDFVWFSLISKESPIRISDHGEFIHLAMPLLCE